MTLSSELLVLKGRKRFLDGLFDYLIKKERTSLEHITDECAQMAQAVAQVTQKFEELGFANELRAIEVEIEFIEYITK